MTDGGQLFWLAEAGAPMHRRCGALDGRVPNIAADTRYSVHGAELGIGQDHEIELGSAQEWQAPLSAGAAPSEAIASGLYGLIRNLCVAEAAGFAGLLPRILAAVDAEVALPGAEIEDATLRRAEPLVIGMIRAGVNGELNGMTETADGLVGLGPGLTPSGDDFLGGLLFATHAWDVAFPAVKSLSAKLSTKRYARRTHLISFRLLDDMAKGHAIAPMHELMNGLISGDSPEDIHGHMMDLIQVGHSTGWDLLTGLLTGLLIGIRAQEG